MFFEDEKDFIDSGADIHISDDGTVTWEDVLNSGDDDLISLDAPKQQTQNISEDAINLGDEIQLVDNYDEDIDDATLAQILNNDTSSSPKQKAFDTFGTASEDEEDEDFDINAHLEDAAQEEQDEEEIVYKEPVRQNKSKQQKSSSKSMPILLSALFAVLVGAGVYFIKEYTNTKGVNQENLPAQNQDLGDINQEDISQENEEEIPVVNEEEINEVKPEENQNDEKKQVIDVSSTGRENPFMPISKYITVSIPQSNINFDKAQVPRPPEEYGEKDENTSKMMTIAVSGIMYDELKPSAIITFDNNDYFVQRGDKLDDYRVVEISRNYVKIALGKNVYKANVGEEFKISSKFYGSAEYLPSKQGGGRQYHSVKESQNDTDNNQYVSENDVEINAR